MSLRTKGTPRNGPLGSSPDARASASSYIGVTTAFSRGLTRSIRSIAASSSSRGWTWRVRTSSAWAVASWNARSLSLTRSVWLTARYGIVGVARGELGQLIEALCDQGQAALEPPIEGGPAQVQALRDQLMAADPLHVVVGQQPPSLGVARGPRHGQFAHHVQQQASELGSGLVSPGCDHRQPDQRAGRQHARLTERVQRRLDRARADLDMALGP